MAFSLYCLINENSEDFPLTLLEKKLSERFSKMEGLQIGYEEDPFDASEKHLRFSWDMWCILVFYETGQHVIDDSMEIQKMAGTLAPFDISSICRRIRAVFSDDYDLEHTEQMVSMIDFLRKIDGAFVYDPQQNDFVK
ncbi:hypothetical protein AAV96_03380 [Acinetobacter sp. AG1]|uniref:hypothetical protein n=1 Tax=Acinetobacter TaxID=469 RepID=UPI000629C3CA|nr:hypothetical protein [Acinetobacter sp. AG1]KKW81453.1 hypothetical protein AAV96_03380 [Acinetobacter sp. AG1]